MIVLEFLAVGYAMGSLNENPAPGHIVGDAILLFVALAIMFFRLKSKR